MSYLIIAGGCLACLGWGWLDSFIRDWKHGSRVIQEARRIIREDRSDDGHELTEARDA